MSALKFLYKGCVNSGPMLCCAGFPMNKPKGVTGRPTSITSTTSEAAAFSLSF